MAADNLVHMANRIGEFFEAMPDREEASLEIVQHMCKFWAPPMRQALLAHLDGSNGAAAGLLPIVRDAVLAHRQLLG